MHGYTHPVIVDKTKDIFGQLTIFVKNIPTNKIFEQPADKWSIAENMQHLIVSTNATTTAFRLPVFMLTLIAGKANRPSRSYDELVSKYKLKLQEGGKASGKFIPKAFIDSSEEKRQKLMSDWNKATARYVSVFNNKKDEGKLDKYIVPHPLLGKITLRELAYFTIYHSLHHLEIIKSRL